MVWCFVGSRCFLTGNFYPSLCSPSAQSPFYTTLNPIHTRKNKPAGFLHLPLDPDFQPIYFLGKFTLVWFGHVEDMRSGTAVWEQ